ncbi:Demethylsterigmatocystin 6-O-methyltransferase [Podospora fimiseda]|uniref:Demethylsterigmatocystin 6-O-methyltransferase n=1 Tax=Podospora fimiseda TaxID=252190 RepID=A0AAN6YS45_9PEZI|nr:Demethylsterigmatocystin 6-O-methyltransferase [Podospora fimiseda]
MSTSSSAFDLVQAAESLLADAKRIAGHEEDDPDDVQTRRKIAETCRKISFEIVPKVDVVKTQWTVIANAAVCNLFICWSAFDHIPLDGSITISELAKALNAEESLISRLCNLLLSTSTLLPGPHPNSLSHSRISPLYLSTSPVSSLHAVAIGNGMKPYSHWPQYFSSYGRRTPFNGQTHTPFSYSWGYPSLPPWEVKALFPEYASQFTQAMKSREIIGGNVQLVGREAIYDFSWVGLIQTNKVVVDVGGGLGQLLRDLIKSVEGLEGKDCVLQDRKEVIDEAEKEREGEGLLKGVRMMEHDFHNVQPVKGALVYILRRILLDYSDDMAINILSKLADAMPTEKEDPKARVIIIEERLIEEPMALNRIVDLVMLNLGGKLRDEKMFRGLAKAAGLKVVKYHTRNGDPLCAVECVKA